MATDTTTPAGNSTEAPAPTLPFQPGQKRPLTPEQLAQWQARVTRATARAEQYHPQFTRGLDSYAKALVAQPAPTDKWDAKMPFRHVENKKAATFHATPEVNLLPVDPQDQAVPYNDILPLREKVLNHELGPDAANAQRSLHKTLIDAIAASGWLITKLGFEQVTLPVETMQPGMFGTPATPTTVNVRVWGRRFITAVSSKKFLVPADFHDTDYDAAPWLAIKGSMALSQAKRLQWTLPAGYEGSGAHKDIRYIHDDGSKDSADPEVPYVEIWYRAAYFDPSVFHPELYRCLILVEGCDAPAWHVDSPYQTLTDTGQLTDDSMLGSPIHVDAMRDMPDSAYVPADLVLGEQLSEEVNAFRTGVSRRRQASRSVLLVADGLGTPIINKIAANEGPVPVPPEWIGDGGSQRAAALIQKGTEPRDNYTAQEYAQQDYNEAFGMSANQSGNQTRKKTTATESRIVQGNSAARAEIDKQRVRNYFVRLVRKFDCIVQRTATQQEIVKILGQQGAALWEAWRNLPGRYAYKIQPDSGQYIDAREYRAQRLEFYNLVRKDPLANGAEVLRELVRAFSMDAGKMVPQDQAQEKPEAPKISISFNAEEALANPAEMQLILAMLEQSGYEIPPGLAMQLQAVAQLRQAVAAMQPQTPEHGGMAKKTEPINKHQSQKTGGVQGAAA